MSTNTKVAITVIGILTGAAFLACGGIGLGILLRQRPATTGVVDGAGAPEPSERLAVAKAKRLAGPFVVRGQCRLENLYTGEFRDMAKTHYSIELKQPGAYVECYIPRDDPNGKKIVDALSAGPRTMTLEIQFVGDTLYEAKIIRVVDWQ